MRMHTFLLYEVHKVVLRMQMANAKKGGTPALTANGRSTPSSLKRGPGRPPKKVSIALV